MTPINFGIPGFFKKTGSGVAEFNENMPPITDDLLVFFDPEYAVFSDDKQTLAVDGDNIRQIWDRGATGNTLNQTTATSQPIYDTTTFGNGIASIKSLNDKLIPTDVLDLDTTTDWTFYLVYKKATHSNIYYWFGGTAGYPRTEHRTTLFQIRSNTGSGRNVTYTDNTDIKIMTITNEPSTGEFKMYINGALIGEAPSGGYYANNPIPFTIAKLYANGTAFMNAGNVLFYTDIHDASQVSQMSNWLNEKYDIYDPYAPPITDDLEIYFNPDLEVYSDAGTTLATDGDNIRQYNDRSGNDNTAAQTTGSKQPVYSTSTLGNGNASIHIDASNVFDLTSGITVGSSSHFTYYTVFKKSAAVNNSTLGSIASTYGNRIDLNDSYIQTFDDDTNSFQSYSWSTDLVIIAVVVDRSDNSYKLYENGSQVLTTRFRTFGQFDFDQLHGSTGITGGNIDYGITLMYNGVAHDATDVGTISDWLNTKYQIY